MRRWAHRTHLAGRLVALLGVACHGAARQQSATGPLVLTDDAGREVRLAGPAHRVVSLAPSITELLFALGAGDQVVGRTVYDKYPPAALQVPAVGDGLNPSVEAIVARHPDLVLLYRSAHTDAAAQQLERLGIPTLVVRHDRLADIARTARLLGRATGQESGGQALGRSVDSVLAQPLPPVRSRIAYVVWDAPPIVIGAGSFLDELARRAGAENVFHDIATPSATVSIETIVARDPDWIVVVRDSVGDEPPAWSRRPEWRVVRAVRQGRFLMLPADLFGQPSARAREAIAEFKKLLSP
ncbi:MAG TPA: helical backbone metal receptor [Gemmatimonadales bacterium]|nr:helical backbone metal receptor [Gemmatimonadales bacterium]